MVDSRFRAEFDIDAPLRIAFLRQGEGVFRVRSGSGHERVLEEGRDNPWRQGWTGRPGPARGPRLHGMLGTLNKLAQRMPIRNTSAIPDARRHRRQPREGPGWPFAGLDALMRAIAPANTGCLHAIGQTGEAPSTYVRKCLAVCVRNGI